MSLTFPQLPALPIERYASLVSPERLRQVLARATTLRELLAGRVVWNVSSTVIGGGVAEMVRSILSYARGARVDARWAVIEGSAEFFRFTKRLHHALHGGAGDGSAIGESERRMFEDVNAVNAADLTSVVRPRDVVIVHDPQPCGMIPALVDRGAHVIWRCHIGHDVMNDEVERGWTFLAPYLAHAHAYVFSRAAYVPAQFVDAARATVIAPTIDPFSAKNQPLAEASRLAILAQAGLVDTDAPPAAATFTREDGTPGRVDRRADIVREGGAPPADTPLIVQVSRWDRLKDPAGVLAGFARLAERAARGTHLVLAGPDVQRVVDDPEGAAVLAEVTQQWRELAVGVRRRVHLASLPTFDVDENAAIVNALQRHATVVVQKSLHEGFGLTVTEAMWKSRPIIASAVGGIQDQVTHGVEGLLLADPRDLDAFASALDRVLGDPDAARRMGECGHARVLQRYLGLESLLAYGGLIERLDVLASPSHGASALRHHTQGILDREGKLRST